jgi:outer membrane cobalamin receptor
MNRVLLPLFLLIPSMLMASSAQLQLHLRDSQDAAIPGATVTISPSGSGQSTISLVSDGAGRVNAQVPLPATVQVQAPGFEAVRREILNTLHAPIIIQMRPAILETTINVVVRDLPAPGAPTDSSALEISRTGARTVYDAVDRLIPSAYITRRGVLGHGLGGSNSITLRGIGGSPSTELLLVVDGRPDAMGLMGHPIPDFYSLTDVGSFRVTQGPASVLYGNRAMGGVLEIEPPALLPGFHTELTATLGSYFTGQDRLSHGGQIGRFHYNVAGGIEHTNGDRPNSSFRNQDGTIRLGYDLNSIWTVSLDGRYGHFNVEDPGTLLAPLSSAWSRVGRGSFTLALNNHSNFMQGSAQFFSSFGHHMIHDGFRSVDNNTGFRLYQNIQLRSNFNLEVGTDGASYGGDARNIKTLYSYGEHHVSEGAGFARTLWAATRCLRLNAGFRYEHNSISGEVAVPEFGASYRLTEKYSLSLGIGKGFRNPTIRELYLFPAPTPALQPERMWNYQASFQFQPVHSVMGWVTGYYADVRNLIVSTGRYPNLKLENIGVAYNRGMDANLRWQVHQRASFRTGYAYLSSTNMAPYAPQNKLNYSLDLSVGKAFISVGGMTVGRTWVNSSHSSQLAGYTTATMHGIFPIGRHWSLLFTIDNLLNRSYQVLDGYPMPGINAALGFTVRF